MPQSFSVRLVLLTIEIEEREALVLFRAVNYMTSGMSVKVECHSRVCPLQVVRDIQGHRPEYLAIHSQVTDSHEGIAPFSMVDTPLEFHPKEFNVIIDWLVLPTSNFQRRAIAPNFFSDTPDHVDRRYFRLIQIKTIHFLLQSQDLSGLPTAAVTADF